MVILLLSCLILYLSLHRTICAGMLMTFNHRTTISSLHTYDISWLSITLSLRQYVHGIHNRSPRVISHYNTSLNLYNIHTITITFLHCIIILLFQSTTAPITPISNDTFSLSHTNHLTLLLPLCLQFALICSSLTSHPSLDYSFFL